MADLIITKFDKLQKQDQKDIQDFVSGYTPNYILSELSEDNTMSCLNCHSKAFNLTIIDGCIEYTCVMCRTFGKVLLK